eukprot:CAMPEP_0169106162 /NCGR_PEP_ID=MMETSP1015-20121227/24189_1 /TAXON_ID=342587 /ORGANISM="Karlodinium micrum, Strain CCMP2283" /LENGTH=83 /DNA_ID=CAMNT_0009167583 /DNA_START=106 /DNA_END=357 /DNA_ORIENTATION=+
MGALLSIGRDILGASTTSASAFCVCSSSSTLSPRKNRAMATAPDFSARAMGVSPASFSMLGSALAANRASANSKLLAACSRHV